MAEGNSVARWARNLTPLVGETLIQISVPRRWVDRATSLVGQQIASVESRGKNLLLHLSGGDTVRCHAMMYGTWQVGEPGMRYWKPESRIRLRLLTPLHEAAFYNGPVVEILSPEEVASHPVLSVLGPDIMAEDFDADEAARRVAAQGSRPIGDTILDQSVVAGIGNVFKSEGLFLARIHPKMPSSLVPGDALDALWEALIPIMWRESHYVRRITTTTEELRKEGIVNYVYRRRGRPCIRCGSPIEMIRQGDLNRTTYFCPVCQTSDALATIEDAA